MYIITGTAAEQLHGNYTLLRLDTLPSGERSYCVLTSDSIPLSEIGILNTLKDMHEAMVVAYENDNYILVNELLLSLKGKFNGMLDSFYESIEQRLSSSS